MIGGDCSARSTYLEGGPSGRSLTVRRQWRACLSSDSAAPQTDISPNIALQDVLRPDNRRAPHRTYRIQVAGRARSHVACCS
jgi:hypothetical protein